MRFPGNANFPADHVFHVGHELYIFARLVIEAHGRLDRRQEQNLILVSIINDGAAAKTLWRRPFKRAEDESCGQIPDDFWRLARVAGVLPVDVPAGIEMEKQTSLQSRVSPWGRLIGD